MADEIAVRYVTIATETRGLMRQIARAFGPGAQIGRRAGQQIGAALNQGFESAKPADVTKLTTRAEDAQKKLTATVERTSRARRNASAQVGIAEQRLLEITESGTAKTSQLLSAQDRVTRARERYINVSRNGVTAIAASNDALQGTQRALRDAQAASETAGRSFNGFGARVRAAMGGNFSQAFASARAAAADAGSASATGFASRFSQVTGRLSGAAQNTGAAYASNLTSSIQRGIAPLPGLVAGVIGVRGIMGFLSAGMDRLSTLQRADIMFRNLGLSTQQTTTQMSDLEGIVTGTSTSMAEAAKTASMLMQAGVASGKPLNDSIRALTNVAAVSGGAADGMGMVMMQIKSAGRLLAQDANQLASRGVNIYGYLAENLGKSYSEIRDMGAEGQISYEMVVDAINAKSGDLAKEMGQTLPAQMANLRTAFANLAASGLQEAMPLMQQAVAGLTDAVKAAVPKVKEFFSWLGGNSASAQMVKTMVVAFGSAVAVFGALKLAVSTIILPFKLATAAISMMNLAWRSNPIGLAVTLLGALVTAAVYAYENIEWFRDGVDSVFKFIGDVISWAWENAIRPAWEGITGFITNILAPAFVWIYQSIILPVWNGIKVAIAVAWSVIKTIFDAYVWVIINVLAPAFRWINENVIKPVWDAIGNVIRWVWENVIRPVWVGAVWYINNVLAPVFKWIYENVIKPVWDAIGSVIQWVWNNVIKPGWDGLIWYINNVLAPAFRWVYENVIKPVWDGIGNVIRWVWENVIRPAWDGINNFITKTMPDAWRTGVGIITDIWNGIIDAVREPIRFIVDVVYNDGFRKNFNDIAKNLGIDELPRWELGFARGGWTGPGSMYQPAGIVHADEFVIRKSSRRKFEEENPGLLDYINATGTMPTNGLPAGPGAYPGQAAYLNTTTLQQGSRTGSVGIQTGPLANFDAPNVLRAWQNVSALKISDSGNPMINVRVEPFSVPGWGMRGYGFSDGQGLIRLNSAALDSAPPAMRRAVAIHEVGHALGLPHVSSEPSVMHPAVANAKWPTNIDVAMMRNLYGAPGEGVKAWGDPGGGGIDIMGFITDKLLAPLKGLWDQMTGQWGGQNLAQVPVAGITRFRDGAVDWLKNALAGVAGFVGDTVKNVGSSVQLTAWMTEALMATGQPLTSIPLGIKRALQESGGDPRAVNNWDINAKRGTPSKGLMQVIDPTFAAYKDPGRENIWDPVHNIIASIRYTLARYGSLQAGWGRPGGYALGGRVAPVKPILFDKGGILRAEGPQWIEHRRTDPDMVLTTRQWEAMYQIATRAEQDMSPRSKKEGLTVQVGSVNGYTAEEVSDAFFKRIKEEEALHVF
ncbi:tape measure protein [Acaricomes phytoseiuli]|uniref:tape measure protein n=1 Tax=Acaricomes phytoseiuli TaxID=291968 RepID=UPI002221A6B1|nr:tape measure protein [Acaricomes phytoseiuli]MCW1249662.1 tape measure protein [Acaricomes phytoseiuli]